MVECWFPPNTFIFFLLYWAVSNLTWCCLFIDTPSNGGAFTRALDTGFNFLSVGDPEHMCTRFNNGLIILDLVNGFEAWLRVDSHRIPLSYSSIWTLVSNVESHSQSVWEVSQFNLFLRIPVGRGISLFALSSISAETMSTWQWICSLCSAGSRFHSWEICFIGNWIDKSYRSFLIMAWDLPKLGEKKGFSIHDPFEFNYILSSYVLSMCFICYPSWIIWTVCNAVPMSFFRLTKILMRISAFPLRPRYIHCSTTCSLPSLSKTLLDHFGVILLNTSVTQTGIFLLRYRNFHCDVWNASCWFLSTSLTCLFVSM